MKIFRNLRRRLPARNKFRNYLAYSIGEIILVVIGILIALGINNRNQERITREKEQLYLIGLHSEFEISERKLQELISVNRKSYEGARQLIAFMDHPNDPPGEAEFSELLFNSFGFDISFNPNNSLLTEIINSGSLRDLSNPELRIRLTNWISTLEDIAMQEQQLGDQREQAVDLFRTDRYSMRTLLDQTGILSTEIGIPVRASSPSNLSLLQDREFENKVLIFILSSYFTETTHYAPLLEEIHRILSLLEAEIEG